MVGTLIGLMGYSREMDYPTSRLSDCQVTDYGTKGLFPLRLRVALRGFATPRNATRSRNGNRP